MVTRTTNTIHMTALNDAITSDERIEAITVANATAAALVTLVEKSDGTGAIIMTVTPTIGGIHNIHTGCAFVRGFKLTALAAGATVTLYVK